MTNRAALYCLINELPDNALEVAERCLVSLRNDPLLRTFLEAPDDDEPLTAEDIAAIEEGKADIARGDLVAWDEVKARMPAGQ